MEALSTPERTPRGHRSWKRFAGIVLLFAVLGPFIGAIIPVMLSFGELPYLTQIGSASKAWGFILALGLFVSFSLGGPQALATGLVMAFWYRRTGVISLWGAPLCALTVLGLRLATVGMPHFGRQTPLPFEASDHFWLVTGHLAVALACAALARRWFVPIRSSEDTEG